MRANASPRKGKLKTMKKLSALMLGAAMILGRLLPLTKPPRPTKPRPETTKTTKKAHVKKTKKSKKNSTATPAATPAPTK
jgi:hypothetical protein